MPDLPELYEALDIELAYIVGRHRVEFSDEEMELMTSIVSALCAAIEVKQSQELHGYLNEQKAATSNYEDMVKRQFPNAPTTMDDYINRCAEEAIADEKETQTTETQEEA